MEYRGQGIEELVRLAMSLDEKIPAFTIERYRDWILVAAYDEEVGVWEIFVCTEDERLYRRRFPILIGLIDPTTNEKFTKSMGSYEHQSLGCRVWFDDLLSVRTSAYMTRWTVELCILYMKEFLLPEVEKWVAEDLSRSIGSDPPGH